MSSKHQWKSEDMREHIITLKNFEGATVSAAKAMSDIQERNLYKEHYTSLKKFTEEELGWTEQRLYQILGFYKMRKMLPPLTQPRLSNERQGRALQNIPEDKRAEVLEEAAKSGKVTAKSIAEAAKIIQIEVIERDEIGHQIPTPAQKTWDRRDEAKEYLQMLSKLRSWAEKQQKSGDKFYAEVNFQELYTDCNNSYANLKDAVPYSVCAVCQGQAPKTCKLCNGRGMISKFSWDHHVTKEQKEMMKKKAEHDAPQRAAM